jgi:GPH family glycoside/pentoside/hexuronide:cation symporter
LTLIGTAATVFQLCEAILTYMSVLFAEKSMKRGTIMVVGTIICMTNGRIEMKRLLLLILLIGLLSACSSSMNDIHLEQYGANIPESPRISINYSPYVNGLNPEKNDKIPIDLVKKQLDILQPYAHTIRLFGVSGELNKIYKTAKKDYGFRIIGGCWIDRNYSDKKIKGELDALIKLVNNGYIDIAVVGSETLYRKDFSADKLIEYINYVKDGIKDKSIPVTTSDTSEAWLNNPELVNVCDVLLVTIYPFFSEVSIEQATDALIATYSDVERMVNGRLVIISETGWVTAGSPQGEAVPSMENAKKYFSEVSEWAYSESIEIVWFSAFDESWKREGIKGDIGGHWGHFTADGELKEAYS